VTPAEGAPAPGPAGPLRPEGRRPYAQPRCGHGDPGLDDLLDDIDLVAPRPTYAEDLAKWALVNLCWRARGLDGVEPRQLPPQFRVDLARCEGAGDISARRLRHVVDYVRHYRPDSATGGGIELGRASGGVLVWRGVGSPWWRVNAGVEGPLDQDVLASWVPAGEVVARDGADLFVDSLEEGRLVWWEGGGWSRRVFWSNRLPERSSSGLPDPGRGRGR
jgi:hypothetical protein